MKIHAIPSNWTLKIEEISPYNFRVTAKAIDGRVIEMSGSNEDSMTEAVIRSIADSDAQVGDLNRKKEIR